MTTTLAPVVLSCVLLLLLLAYSLMRAAGKPTPKPAPRPYGPPLFPQDKLCVCGCPAGEHLALWEGDEFKGTRCTAKEHGGHKLRFATIADLEKKRQEQLDAGAWRE